MNALILLPSRVGDASCYIHGQFSLYVYNMDDCLDFVTQGTRYRLNDINDDIVDMAMNTGYLTFNKKGHFVISNVNTTAFGIYWTGGKFISSTVGFLDNDSPAMYIMDDKGPMLIKAV